MQKILSDSKVPVLEDPTKLPVPGVYYAKITDAETKVIDAVSESRDTCLVVRYKLVHAETLAVFDFCETYYPYKGNARTDDFLDFLYSKGYDFASDDEIIGLRATVDVVWEFLGGYAHPAISYRPWRFSQVAQGCADEDLPF